jgi:hypothetical protein
MFNANLFQPASNVKNSKPLFSELGNLLNLIRNFNALLNNEYDEQHVNKEGFNEVWYFTNPAISNIQIKLNKLEADIANYFANYSTYNTHNSKLSSTLIQHTFIPAFKLICNDYFSLQLSVGNKNMLPCASVEKENAKVYQIHTKQMVASR